MKSKTKKIILMTGLGVFLTVLVLGAGLWIWMVTRGVERFTAFNARAKQVEAHIKLLAVHTGLQVKLIEEGSVEGATLDNLQLAYEGPIQEGLYQVTLTVLGETEYIALAEAPAGALAPCADEDVWSLNPDGEIIQKVDGMATCR